MATEYTCITRKIEVHLHRHGEGEEAIERMKREYQIWDDINNNLYKAANRIVSHCFFNDAYEYRLKIHSPRFKAIEKALVEMMSKTDEEREAMGRRGVQLVKSKYSWEAVCDKVMKGYEEILND
jgi:hypothetical protein